MRWGLIFVGAAACALAACSAEEAAVDGTTVLMSFAGTGFYDAPFPSDHRLDAHGRVDLKGFPNPSHVALVDKAAALLSGIADGFGLTSAIQLRTSGAIDPDSLPTLDGSVKSGASAFVVALEADAKDANERYPIYAAYRAEGGPYGADRTISLLPLQGVPLRPGRRYAAVITTGVRDSAGDPLVASDALRALRAGDEPPGLKQPALGRYRRALARLEAMGVDPDEIAGLAVFSTWRPRRGLQAVVAAMDELKTPAPIAPFSAKEVTTDFCAYETRYRMPVYQHGKPPYPSTGGGFRFDSAGEPKLARRAEARLVITVPRGRAMPSGGWPTVVFIRTGGGGDRPLVERGRQGADGKAIEAASGPARDFARAGWAAVSIDGPHGGLRNVTKGDEQFLMFNIVNPEALRDNVRQSAAELTLLPEMVGALSFDVSGCPGASGKARFDSDHLALMGHSMGGTIAPLVLAEQPAYEAAILSGAGGSWIENIVYKEHPLRVRPLVEGLLRYGPIDRHEPVLSLLQWAGEPADPPVYARSIVSEPGRAHPRQVLMLQGIVDHYILPPIANATSLSLGLDLAGKPLDAGEKSLARFTPLAKLLPLVDRKRIALPARGNRQVSGEKVTAVVVQHAEDGIQDGHEIAFQRSEPKLQYRCFLAGLLTSGPPPVIAATSSSTSCR